MQDSRSAHRFSSLGTSGVMVPSLRGIHAPRGCALLFFHGFSVCQIPKRPAAMRIPPCAIAMILANATKESSLIPHLKLNLTQKVANGRLYHTSRAPKQTISTSGTRVIWSSCLPLSFIAAQYEFIGQMVLQVNRHLRACALVEGKGTTILDKATNCFRAPV